MECHLLIYSSIHYISLVSVLIFNISRRRGFCYQTSGHSRALANFEVTRATLYNKSIIYNRYVYSTTLEADEVC